MDELRGLVVWGTVAAVGLWECAMIAARLWPDTLTWRSDHDFGTYVVLVLGCLAALAHLTYDRWANNGGRIGP